MQVVSVISIYTIGITKVLNITSVLKEVALVTIYVIRILMLTPGMKNSTILDMFKNMIGI